MGIEPTEDASQRPPPVLKTGPVTRSGSATAAFVLWKSARCTTFSASGASRTMHVEAAARSARLVEFLELLAYDLRRQRQVLPVALHLSLAFLAQHVTEEFLHIGIN